MVDAYKGQLSKATQMGNVAVSEAETGGGHQKISLAGYKC